MRVLVTGAAGFVGPYVGDALRDVFGRDVAIVPTSRDGGAHPQWGPVTSLDVTDASAVETAISHHRPTHVIHLAGISAPADARAQPRMAWKVHVEGTLNVAHAILANAPDCVLAHVGSGLVYGESANTGKPLDETTVLAPVDDYGVTKAAADLALGAFSRSGLKCVRLRPFNHCGPGQSEAFVVSAFAMQIARIEAGLVPPVLSVGNLDAERDFLDVRDVARAYALVVRNSNDINPSTILNIASGQAERIQRILDFLIQSARVKISVERDGGRQRLNDLPRVVGDASRARRILGWAPKHDINDALLATLDHCRRQTVERIIDEGQ